MMTLAPGQASGTTKTSDHPRSEQVLFVLRGVVFAEVGRVRKTLRAGDSVLVPAGAPHRFSNCGKRAAVTFIVYGPPAYESDEQA